jgi:hypothetical membrane protein
MGYSDRQIARAILFVGALQFVVGLNVAEDLYPGYNVSMNYISDLGATRNATCNLVQPSSAIFNSSVILSGLLILVAAFFIHRAFQTKPLSILLVLTGIGAIGVGVFSETTLILHWFFPSLLFSSARFPP